MKLKDMNVKDFLKMAAIVIVMLWVSQNLQYAGNILKGILDILMPLICAFAIAYILNIPMRKIEGWIGKLSNNRLFQKCKRVIALLLAIVCIGLLILVLLQIVVPEIVNTIEMLADSLPQGYENFQHWIGQYADALPQLQDWIAQYDLSSFNWDSLAKEALNITSISVLGIFGTTFSLVTTVAEVTMTFIMAFILAIYFLCGKEMLLGQAKKLMTVIFPDRMKCKLFTWAKIADNAFSNYIIGKCIDAIVVGLLCTGGMLLLHIPYAGMIGAIVGATALIPIVGGYIGVLIGAFLILMVNPIKALEFVVFFLVMQTLEGNIVYPKILGDKVGLPPVWILVAVMIGGTLFGIAGMIIGVPILSTIYEIISIHINEKLAEKNGEVRQNESNQG